MRLEEYDEILGTVTAALRDYQTMLKLLRTGKGPSGAFTVYQSDEGWLSVHLMNTKNRLTIKQLRASDPYYARVLQEIQAH